MSLIELVERVEAASGPDRELDLRIQMATNPEWAPIKENEVNFHVRYGGHPRFTASLDAAMSLVPEEMRDEIEITTLYKVARVGINLNHGPDGSPFYGSNESSSIPLAICAAALRARAQQEQTI